MPLTAADIHLRYSTLSGGAGNTAPGHAGASNGKYVSQTVMPDGQLSNLFGAITGLENGNDNVDYQCAFLVNTHSSIAFEDVVLWIAETEGAGEIALAELAADPKGSSDISSPTAQALSTPNKDIAPAGIGAFSIPVDEASAIELGTVGPGQVRPFWVRRTAANTPPTTLERHRLRFKGKTVN